MARTTMNDLHNILFEALERTLNPDPEAPLTLESAQIIVKIAETVIASGRAEVDYLKAIGTLNPGGLHEHRIPKTTLFLEKENK